MEFKMISADFKDGWLSKLNGIRNDYKFITFNTLLIYWDYINNF